ELDFESSASTSSATGAQGAECTGRQGQYTNAAFLVNCAARESTRCVDAIAFRSHCPGEKISLGDAPTPISDRQCFVDSMTGRCRLRRANRRNGGWPSSPSWKARSFSSLPTYFICRWHCRGRTAPIATPLWPPSHP